MTPAVYWRRRAVALAALLAAAGAAVVVVLMIRGRLKRRRNVAVTVNVDGFGHRAIKRVKFQHFAHGRDGLYDGFKQFFNEDTDLFTPRDVARLHPRPDVVVYE